MAKYQSSYLKVDSSPLDAFLEKISVSVLRTEGEIVKLRNENLSIRKDMASVMVYEEEILKLRDENSALRQEMTAMYTTETQNLRAQLIQLAEKIQKVSEQFKNSEKEVHLVSEKLKTIENRIEIKADLHSVAEVRDQFFTLSRSSQDLAGNLVAYKSEMNRNIKEIKSQISAVSDHMMEQFAILNQARASQPGPVKGTVVDDSWKQIFERTQRACDRNDSELQAFREEFALFKLYSEQEINKKLEADHFGEFESKFRIIHEEGINSVKNQIKLVADQILRTDKQLQYSLEKIDEMQSQVEESVKFCKKNTTELIDFRRMNRDFLSRCELELAKKVGMEAVQTLLREKATKRDCEEIIQSMNYEFDEKLMASNRFMQNLREDIDVVLTMIMQDVHNSQSNDGRGVPSGAVHCISCFRPMAVPKRRLLKALSAVPTRPPTAPPNFDAAPGSERGSRPPSPASRIRSSSALSRW